ncbi:MAG TPA: VWA domain-containing protein [Candidatus Limnocylindrales bacterium]
MTLMYPLMLLVVFLVTGIAILAYVAFQRQRSAALRATGLTLTVTGGRTRRHVPYILFLAALPLLLLGLARPQAEISVPRVSGTVLLVFDVSKSMAADDVKPNRLAAAKTAANSFVKAQPETVDVGVVIFGASGFTTQKPTNDHRVVEAAIERLNPSGGTSLTQAILAALTAIVGKPVTLPDEAAGELPADLGYHREATIVLFSDGEDTTQPETAELAAEMAANAGVRIETIGIGTAQGATVEVDGFQVASALDEEMLTNLSAITGGKYHPAQDASALNEINRAIDLRINLQPENVELTGMLAAAALLLLTIGGLLMIRWYGRIV